MRNDKENVILEKTLAFSLSIIKYCEVLEQGRKYVIAKQLLRSATSMEQMYLKHKMAKAKLNFIHKMKLAAKEAGETLYWLTLCEKSESYYFESKLKTDLEEIIRILSRIISTSKTRIV